MNKLIKKLKFDYEVMCYEIVKRFEKKHGYKFEGWIGDDIGGIADFIGMYFFDLKDMANDIFTGKPKGLIFEWQQYLVDNSEQEYSITFENYCKGERY